MDYNSAALVYDGTQVFRQWTTSLQMLTPGSGKSIALNGQVVAGPATGVNANQMDSALGGRVGSGFAGDTQYYTGDICEILIYNRNLSAEEKALVEAYLAYKWFDARTATGVIPANTAVNLTASGTNFDLNGATQPIGSLTGVTGSLVTLGEGTLTVAGTNSTVFAGTISGNGTLAKAGSGTLKLTAANALPATGSLKLVGGTLDLSAVTSSAASLSVTADSTLELGAGTGAISFDNQSAAPWSGMLTIDGTLGAQSVRFQPVLSAPQLAAIRFAQRPGAHTKCTAEGYLAIIPRGTVIMIR